MPSLPSSLAATLLLLLALLVSCSTTSHFFVLAEADTNSNNKDSSTKQQSNPLTLPGGSDIRRIAGPWYLQQLIGPHKAAYLLFHASWSPESRRILSTTWGKFATRMRGLVKVGEMDCDNATHAHIAKTGFHVEGFPTVVFWPMGNRNLKENMQPQVFQGELSFERLEEHALDMLKKNSRDLISYRKNNATTLTDLKTHVFLGATQQQREKKKKKKNNNNNNKKKVLVAFVEGDADTNRHAVPPLYVISSFVKFRFENAMKFVIVRMMMGKGVNEESGLVHDLNSILKRKITVPSIRVFSMIQQQQETADNNNSTIMIITDEEAEEPCDEILLPSSSSSSSSSTSSSSPDESATNSSRTMITSDDLMKFLLRQIRPKPSVQKPLHECPTLRECFEHHAAAPFVVRQTPEFSHTSFDFGKELALSSDVAIQGVSPTGDALIHNLSTLMRHWLDDALDMNVFDFPVDLFPIPKVFDDFELEPEANDARLVPTLSYRGAYTRLHMDPADRGGAYMHLWAGKKLWHFIHPKYLKRVMTREELIDRQPDDDDENDGDDDDEKIEVFSVVAGANDTVVFPPGWMHRVWTLEKSFGVVGYITTKGAREIQEFSLSQEEMRRETFGLVESTSVAGSTKAFSKKNGYA